MSHQTEIKPAAWIFSLPFLSFFLFFLSLVIKTSSAAWSSVCDGRRRCCRAPFSWRRWVFRSSRAICFSCCSRARKLATSSVVGTRNGLAARPPGLWRAAVSLIIASAGSRAPSADVAASPSPISAVNDTLDRRVPGAEKKDEDENDKIGMVEKGT